MKIKKIVLLLLTAALMVSAVGCKKEDVINEPEAKLEGDLTSVIEKIYENTGFDLMTANNTVDLKDSDSVQYNMGLEDASKIKEAVVSEAMIGSQAYSMVLARVNNAADAKAVADAMLKGINQRKWICVMADDLKVAVYGDAVLLVMIASTMEEVATSQKLVDAFEEICGGKLDVVLSK